MKALISGYQALTLVFVFLLLSTGCASSPPPAGDFSHADNPETRAAYKAQIEHVVEIAEDTPGYKRIPLDTQDERRWFADLTFRYWDDQIGRSEFMQEGLSRFPDHGASLELVADALKD